jgi:hypothetical protein
MITKHAFQVFLAETAGLYPYSEIRCTRNGLYPKWLLLKSNEQPPLFQSDGWYLIPTSSFRNETMQEMIVTNHALPFPSDWNEIAYCMEHWGRAIDAHWQQEVLAHLSYYIVHNKRIEKKEVMFRCISILVRKKIETVMFDYCAIEAAMCAFQNYFDGMYTRNSQYFNLAVKSIQYADSLVVFNTAPASRATVVEADNVES